jgi:uncharacterized protein (DUF2062 family)
MRRLREQIRRIGLLIVTEHTEPAPISWAVALGVLVGFSPFYGFHLLICLALAWALRLNKLIMYAAAHVSTPPLAPFVGFASIQVGEWLRFRRFAFPSLAALRATPLSTLAKQFFFDWAIGGAVLGVVFGAALGVLTYAILSRRTPLELRQAAARYRQAARKFRWYAWFKYRMDPCYAAAAPFIASDANVVDLGAGIGMLGTLLRVRGHQGELSLVEWDEEKASCAEAVLGVPVTRGDAWSVPLPFAQAVVVFDMLHYRDAAAQRALLGRIADRLPARGLLLIREHDAAARGRVTRWIERTAVMLGWNRASAVHFRSAAELAHDLADAGFESTHAPVAGNTHPGNVLFVAYKKSVR